MPVNLSSKKSDAIATLVQFAPKALVLVAQLKELIDYATDNGFASGGTNAIVDSDFTGDNGHVTAADFNACLAAYGTVLLNNTQKATLRKVSRTPVAING